MKFSLIIMKKHIQKGKFYRLSATYQDYKFDSINADFETLNSTAVNPKDELWFCVEPMATVPSVVSRLDRTGAIFLVDTSLVYMDEEEFFWLEKIE